VSTKNLLVFLRLFVPPVQLWILLQKKSANGAAVAPHYNNGRRLKSSLRPVFDRLFRV
jgi:hypothetical protein